MLTSLRQGRVAGLRVTVACARSLDDVPHDVYLLDLTPADDPKPEAVDSTRCPTSSASSRSSMQQAVRRRGWWTSPGRTAATVTAWVRRTCRCSSPWARGARCPTPSRTSLLSSSPPSPRWRARLGRQNARCRGARPSAERGPRWRTRSRASTPRLFPSPTRSTTRPRDAGRWASPSRGDEVPGAARVRARGARFGPRAPYAAGRGRRLRRHLRGARPTEHDHMAGLVRRPWAPILAERGRWFRARRVVLGRSRESGPRAAADSDQAAERLGEAGGGRAVDHGVVEAQRERQHRSGNDLSVVRPRAGPRRRRRSTIRVSGASGIAQPQPWVNIPIDVTPDRGPEGRRDGRPCRGDPDRRAPQRTGQPHQRPRSARSGRALGGGPYLARCSISEISAHDVRSAVCDRSRRRGRARPCHCRSTVAPMSTRSKERMRVAGLPGIHLGVQRDRAGDARDDEPGPRHRAAPRAAKRARRLASRRARPARAPGTGGWRPPACPAPAGVPSGRDGARSPAPRCRLRGGPRGSSCARRARSADALPQRALPRAVGRRRPRRGRVESHRGPPLEVVGGPARVTGRGEGDPRARAWCRPAPAVGRRRAAARTAARPGSTVSKTNGTSRAWTAPRPGEGQANSYMYVRAVAVDVRPRRGGWRGSASTSRSAPRRAGRRGWRPDTSPGRRPAPLRAEPVCRERLVARRRATGPVRISSVICRDGAADHEPQPPVVGVRPDDDVDVPAEPAAIRSIGGAGHDLAVDHRLPRHGASSRRPVPTDPGPDR